jgi:hypothetical protein
VIPPLGDREADWIAHVRNEQQCVRLRVQIWMIQADMIVSDVRRGGRDGEPRRRGRRRLDVHVDRRNNADLVPVDNAKIIVDDAYFDPAMRAARSVAVKDQRDSAASARDLRRDRNV